jgi:Ni,Fe-hydrogenase III large subunit
VTEDAAEAVALGLVHRARGWVVCRRLQREEYGDWLLYDAARGAFVALEVSGTDDGDATARMAVKLGQVTLSPTAEVRAACVVRFVEPLAALKLLPEVSS